MKFYTLDFDCNQPTAQQVNVPTNTDYKIGIKVSRNGEIQNLTPSSITLGGLSADADKTNSYVTFTLSAGDEASYTSEKLAIEKGYDAEFYKPAFVEQNTTGATVTVTIISADLSDFVGQTLKPEDIYYSAKYQRSELTIDHIESLYGPYWRDNEDSSSAVDWKPFIEDKDGNTKMWLIASSALRQEYCNVLSWPLDKPGFFINNPDDPGHIMIVDSYTVQEGDRLVMGKGLNVSKDRYYGGKISIKAGTPFSASFDLNTNIFKSQQGDKAESVENASTAKLTGVYADGTEFDYDIVIA